MGVLSRGQDVAELWTRSGAAELTGRADGPPLAPSGPVLTRLEPLLQRWSVDAAKLLSARATELGWNRQGSVSANGSARLLPTSDGYLAVNLARDADRELIAAVVQNPIADGAEWPTLTAWAAGRTARDAAARLQLLGLAAAVVGEAANEAAVVVHAVGVRGSLTGIRVLDFSALWAGPLAVRLLSDRGAEVVTVADRRRPDPSHAGAPRFREWLHAGREHREIDLHDQSAMLSLAGDADVIIEASRPRALRGHGLIAERWLAKRPGRVWLSITGYGRAADRIAFGDDAAAAGGLLTWDEAGPVFCGDAIADPLTGLRAADEIWQSLVRGGGELIEVRMAGVCAELVR